MYNTRYSCPILMKIEFPRQFFSKNIEISNFMKIRPVGAEQTDGRTDMTKRIVALHNVTYAPKY
jgi:hypothetical protein